MIHIIKNYKWVIASSLICVIFGLLTFFTFINQSFITLNDLNLQILLIIDLVLLVIFFSLVIYETYKILKERKKGKLGSETSLRYILFFATTTLLPSIFIAIFSLILFLIVIYEMSQVSFKTLNRNFIIFDLKNIRNPTIEKMMRNLDNAYAFFLLFISKKNKEYFINDDNRDELPNEKIIKKTTKVSKNLFP